jgi:hypothetical protein
LWWRARHHEELRKLEETKAELERVQRQWPDVLHFAAFSDHHRKRNGFSEAMAAIYRGGH